MLKYVLLTTSVLFMGTAHAGKKVEPTPELMAAVTKITNAKIARVETGRSGLRATYEVEFDPASGQGVHEIEVLQKDFSIVDAEGKSLTANSFTPGGELKPLSELVVQLQNYSSFTPSKWELDKKMGDKWVYEIKGTENGVEREYHFDAKTLALIKTEDD